MVDVKAEEPARTWTWRLTSVVLAMAALFAFDILVPSVIVLPFACVPVVVAAVWAPARVVAWLAGLSVLMAAVSGWSNDYFTSLNDILWMLAMVTVGLVAVLLARTRQQLEAQREVPRALRESEERYRLLAENSTDVVVRSEGNKITWTSPSLVAVLGWQPDDWIGHSITEYAYPGDMPFIEEACRQLHAGQATAFKARAVDAGGAWHWVEVHGHVYLDARGQPDGYLASLRVVDKEVEAEADLARRATFDDLTGALKREPALRRLRDIGQRPRAPGSQTAVLFVDIDDFKHVNDTLGHAAGDAVLRRFAEAMRESVRAGDTIARMGGDEFVVILPGLHDVEEAVAVAEKILGACAQPISLPAGTAQATVSIGVTISEAAEESRELIARADHAMYRAKQAGRNQVVTVTSATTHAA